MIRQPKKNMRLRRMRLLRASNQERCYTAIIPYIAIWRSKPKALRSEVENLVHEKYGGHHLKHKMTQAELKWLELTPLLSACCSQGLQERQAL